MTTSLSSMVEPVALSFLICDLLAKEVRLLPDRLQ